MFYTTAGLIYFVFDYLIVAIVYNWKQFSIKRLWNVRFIIIAVYNAIIGHFSFIAIIKIILSIYWTEETPDGRIGYVYPLAKYYLLDWGISDVPRLNLLMLSLTYIIIGSILLYLPNKYILKITNKWKCILITILLTIIPVLIFDSHELIRGFFYYK